MMSVFYISKNYLYKRIINRKIINIKDKIKKSFFAIYHHFLLEVDTQQLNVPANIIANGCIASNENMLEIKEKFVTLGSNLTMVFIGIVCL